MGINCGKIKATSRALTLLLLATACYGKPILAEEEQVPVKAAPARSAYASIGITHTPPFDKPISIPAGASITLRAQLFNTNDVHIRLLMLASVDERLIEVDAREVLLNKYDNPEYTFEVSTPRAALEYQFVALLPDGTLSVSDRYAIKQACQVAPSIANIVPPEAASGQEHLRAAFQAAKDLEAELMAYDQTRYIIDKIYGELNRLEKGSGS